MNWNAADNPFPRSPRRRKVSHEIDDELAFHLARSADEVQASGAHSRTEAEAIALERFGDLEKVRLRCLKLAWKERIMEKMTSRPVLKYGAVLAAAGVIVFLLLSIRVQYVTAEEAYQRARHAEVEARDAMHEALRAREENEALNQILLETLRGVDPAAAGQAPSVREILENASQRLESEFSDSPDTLERLQAIIQEARDDLQSVETDSTADVEGAGDE